MPDQAIKPVTNNELASLKRQQWTTIAIAVAIGMLGTYLAGTRPAKTQAKRQMASVEHRIAKLQEKMESLVGGEETVEQSNPLLSQLRPQREQLQDASRAVAAPRRRRVATWQRLR